jgi:CTP:molybdopterin cytidylyltransferase MocA
MICVLIPAGGLSSRMGQPKLLLELGGNTVIARVVAAFHSAGIERVLVVTPPDLPALAETSRQAGASVLGLPNQTPDMRSTVEAGLAWIEQTWKPNAHDAWFLTPADHPVLAPQVIRRLREARHATPTHSIFIPTHDGKRGHPALIGWQHVTGIRVAPAGTGLNQYLRTQGELVREVPVRDPGVLVDLDTAEDWARVMAEFSAAGRNAHGIQAPVAPPSPSPLPPQ